MKRVVRWTGLSRSFALLETCEFEGTFLGRQQHFVGAGSEFTHWRSDEPCRLTDGMAGEPRRPSLFIHRP